MSISNSTGSSGFPVPVGTIIAFAGQVIPPKYLLCNGTAYNTSQYPILFNLLGGTNTPNLVGGIIGGGTTRQQVTAGIIGGNSAEFSIGVANMPAFTTTVATFSATGTFPENAQTTSDAIKCSPTGSDCTPIFANGQSKISSLAVSGVFTGELVAHAGDPVESNFVTIDSITPREIAIQYLIKAGY
jgi:microcystin-dependent protein